MADATEAARALQGEHACNLAIQRHVRQLRRIKGWTTTDLAGHLLSYLVLWTASTVTKVEKGHRRKVSPYEAQALAELFEVSLEDFLNPDADFQRPPGVLIVRS